MKTLAFRKRVKNYLINKRYLRFGQTLIANMQNGIIRNKANLMRK